MIFFAVLSLLSALNVYFLFSATVHAALVFQVSVLFVLWAAGYWVMYHRERSEATNAGVGMADSHGTVSAFEPMQHPERHFYERLYEHFSEEVRNFEQSREHCERVMHAIRQALQDASMKGSETQLAALNALFASARTGDLGRGFATVSRDLQQLGSTAEEELQALNRVITELTMLLARCEYLGATFVQLGQQPPTSEVIAQADTVCTRLQFCQRTLGRLDDRFRERRHLDIRWVQFNDSLRRLLSELMGQMTRLEINLSDLLSDLRLIRLNPAGLGTETALATF